MRKWLVIMYQNDWKVYTDSLILFDSMEMSGKVQLLFFITACVFTIVNIKERFFTRKVGRILNIIELSRECDMIARPQ